MNRHKSEQAQISYDQLRYIRQVKKELCKIHFLRWFFFLLFLIMWEVAAGQEWINSFIFCSPSKIFHCFIDMLLHQSLARHIGITVYETLIGFILVVVISILIAMILWWNETVSKVTEPYLVVLNSLPKSALAPVLIVWLGASMQTIIVCAMSVAIFGSILNIYTCFQTVDPDKIKLIKTLKGSKLDILRLVIIPSSIPNMISVMKVNIGLSLVGVVIGEFLAAKAGLGYLIIYGSQTFKLSWVLMSIVLLCILAMLLYQAIRLIENHLGRYCQDT